MSPLHVMIPRPVRRAVQRGRNWSLSLAILVTAVLGGALGTSSMAQPAAPGQDPSYFAATGYRVSSPEMLSYFQQHGGVRTFGYPVSSEFPLLGQPVQIFQRQALSVGADGSITPLDLLSPSMLPIQHIDGLTLPAVDPELVEAAPVPGSPDFQAQALSFITAYVPDDWNGVPVNFQTMFLNTVSCADAFTADQECDPNVLQGLALDVWGLPTSLPTVDPTNENFVYQRFQRGIMHYSRIAGSTQGLLVGDWLKRVMVGVDLPPQTGAEVRNSRFYAQYAPSRPLALDRVQDLPDTSLAQAFSADTLRAAAQSTGTGTAEPTLPPSVAETATSVSLTSVALNATSAALNGTQTLLTATALVATQTALAVSPSPAQTGTPQIAVQSDIPVVNLGCMGDEQMWFVPRRPRVGTHVDISVTSKRHHDARTMRLGGPTDAGPVIEHLSPLGFTWTWTVVPSIEEFHEWTFYADGLRPCITSGFNAFAPLGATATPTVTPVPTNTPGTATATPTNTPVPIPNVTGVSNQNALTCNTTITITGGNFGSPPANFGTSVILVNGANTFTLSQVGTGSNTALRVTTPPVGSSIDANAATFIVVSNSGGDSPALPVRFTTPTGCV